MRVVVSFMTIACCIGCTHPKTKSSVDSPSTAQASLPAIGDHVSTTSAKRLSGHAIVDAHGHAFQTYSMTWSEHELSLGVDDDDAIRYIAIFDSDFVSPDGTKIGAPYRELKAFGSETINAAYCYYVKLPSGWNAAFQKGLTKVPLPHEPVRWFFKGATVGG